MSDSSIKTPTENCVVAITDGYRIQNMKNLSVASIGNVPLQSVVNLPPSPNGSVEPEKIKITRFDEMDTALLQAEMAIDAGDSRMASLYIKAVREFLCE